MFIRIILLIFTLSIISAHHRNKHCSKNGLFRNEKDRSCSTYIECRNRERIISTCPSGQIFYPEIKTCVENIGYTCGKPIKCGKVENRLYPDDCGVCCKKSTYCRDNYRVIQACGPYKWVNPINMQCEYMEKCNNIRPCFKDGLFPNGLDPSCSTYIECANNKSVISSCHSGQIFYPEIRKCVDKTGYTCGEPIKCGKKENRGFPEGCNQCCEKYTYCENDYRVIKICEPNKWFYAGSAGVCKYNSKCI